jgi:hypothetical protein
MDQPAPANDFQSAFVTRVAESFVRVTGGNIGLDPAAPGRSAWGGDFALLCHTPQAILMYANRFALGLWEMDWETMLVTPSRETAPEEDRATRAALLDEVARNGFIRNYTGRRVSRSGRLFLIENATVWTLRDELGAAFGTGAFFRSVTFL